MIYLLGILSAESKRSMRKCGCGREQDDTKKKWQTMSANVYVLYLASILAIIACEQQLIILN